MTPVAFELPDTTDLASVNRAEVEVIRLATQGHLKPREALVYTRMLEHRRRAIGDVELEEMLERLEREGKQARGARS
jgi:hypothetical protein